jgi:hypothetical protein
MRGRIQAVQVSGADFVASLHARKLAADSKREKSRMIYNVAKTPDVRNLRNMLPKSDVFRQTLTIILWVLQFGTI